MSKLVNTSVSGNFTVDSLLIAGAGGGFQNMIIFTTGTAATFTFPTSMQVPGARFKITGVGGGGAGGGTSTTAGLQGGGGGSGGVVIAYLTIISGLYTLTYTVGAAGAVGAAAAAGGAGGSTTVIYNSITYTGAGGAGGPTGAVSLGGGGGAATNGTLNIPGGRGGSSGTMAATTNICGFGANTPRGFGQGGMVPASSGAGITGSGYGAGGSGSFNGPLTGTRIGGAGRPGLLIIEY